jgi:hypothetical protein
VTSTITMIYTGQQQLLCGSSTGSCPEPKKKKSAPPSPTRFFPVSLSLSLPLSLSLSLLANNQTKPTTTVTRVRPTLLNRSHRHTGRLNPHTAGCG